MRCQCIYVVELCAFYTHFLRQYQTINWCKKNKWTRVILLEAYLEGTRVILLEAYLEGTRVLLTARFCIIYIAYLCMSIPIICKFSFISLLVQRGSLHLKHTPLCFFLHSHSFTGTLSNPVTINDKTVAIRVT